MTSSSPSNSFAPRALLAVIVVAAAAIHTVRILHAPALQSANDRSRWCTVWSLLERGTYQIDEIRQRHGWDTIDLVRVDGHFYSTKPPLLSTWVSGVTWLVQRATGWTLQDQPQPVTALTLLIVNGVPFVLMLTWLAGWLVRTCSSTLTAATVLTVAAFGTLWSPFLCTLNNHAVAACGAFVGALCWLEADRASSRIGRFALFAAWGLAAMWTACHDLPAALLTLLFAWQAWRRDRAATLYAFLPAAALPATAFLATNLLAFGTWRPAYAGYGGETYLFIHEGAPSYWLLPQGVDRNLDSPLTYLLHSTIGHHGWFSLTPVWLIAIWGAWRRPFLSTAESVRFWTLVTTAALMAFYLSRTENYNYGGVSCGLRWAVVFIPLWTVSLVPALEAARGSIFAVFVGLLALAVSIGSAFDPGERPWQQPWLFRAMEQVGWIDYRETPPPLKQTLYTWFNSIPEATPAAPQPSATWEQDGDPSTTLTLTVLNDETIAGRRMAVVTAERKTAGESAWKRTIRLDREAFAAGRKPSECVVWTDVTVTPAEQQADLAFLRGLPLLRSYHPGFVRYIKTPIRQDAFECQRIAAQVEHRTAEDRPMRRHRVDVWIADDVPFGVVRYDATIADPDTGTIVSQHSWLLSRCIPAAPERSPLTVETLKARSHPR